MHCARLCLPRRFAKGHKRGEGKGETRRGWRALRLPRFGVFHSGSLNCRKRCDAPFDATLTGPGSNPGVGSLWLRSARALRSAVTKPSQSKPPPRRWMGLLALDLMGRNQGCALYKPRTKRKLCFYWWRELGSSCYRCVHNEGRFCSK